MNMPTCEPIPDDGFIYRYTGVGLDIPDMTTAPVGQAGSVPASTAFILFWDNPSTSTQNAINGSTAGNMTFLTADGSIVTAQVGVSSNGSVPLVASVTVLFSTPE